MNDVDLGTVSRDKLLASSQTPIFLVLTSHNVDLSTQLTDTEIPSFCLHGPHSKEAILDGSTELPFDYLLGRFRSFPNDVKAVVGPEVDRVGNSLPFVVVLLWKVDQSCHIRQYLLFYFLIVLAESIDNGV